MAAFVQKYNSLYLISHILISVVSWGVTGLNLDLAEAQPFAYVTNFGSDTVSVIDTDPASPDFNTVVAAVGLVAGSSPTGVAVTPDGTRAYAANQGPNTVSVIDTTTNTRIDVNPGTPLVDDIPVGTNPNGIAITPDGTRAYVVNISSNSVSVIDTDPASATFNQVVATVLNVNTLPVGIAITPDGTRAYATGNNNAFVIGINVSTNLATNFISTAASGLGPSGIAITPDGTRAYVANNGFNTNTVTVIDTDPANVGTFNTVVATVNVGGGGNGPSGIAITPDGTRAYVTNEDSDTVSEIDTDPMNMGTTFNTVVATVNVGDGPLGSTDNPSGIAITPDGTRAYVALTGPGNVASDDAVSVIDTDPASPNFRTQIATVTVQDRPTGVAIATAGGGGGGGTDTDGDGIDDDVDFGFGPVPTMDFSNDPTNNSYSDINVFGGTTVGTVVLNDQTAVTVVEEPNPKGVRIKAVGPPPPARSAAVFLTHTDAIMAFGISNGDEIILTRGSDIVEVIQGPVEGTAGDIAFTIPTGAILEVTRNNGQIQIQNNSPPGIDPIIVENGGQIIEISPGESVTASQVEMDIKPGSDPNSINPKKKGVIPVAILTTSILDGDSADFDATQVDSSTVLFGPGGAKIAHKNSHVEDVDGDGDQDLVLHFKAQDAGISCGDTEADLTGQTFSGDLIQGNDSVNTVGCK